MVEEGKQATTLIEALIQNDAVAYDKSTSQLRLTDGKVTFYKPTQAPHPHETDTPDATLFYSVDLKDLQALDALLEQEGFCDFEYINHGEHAIIFSARDRDYLQKKGTEGYKRKAERTVLRIHFGEPQSRKRALPNAFSALGQHTIDGKISCEELEYFNVLDRKEIDPRIILGLGVSCLSHGYMFDDAHGANVAMRTGDTRVGILEPQAILNLNGSANPEKIRGMTDVFTHRMNEQWRQWNSLKKIHARLKIQDPTFKELNEYSQGDVIETLSDIVVILNGNFFDSSLAGQPTRHPCLEERRALLKKLLNDNGCMEENGEAGDKNTLKYEDFMGEFIVIHTPNPHPSDTQLLAKSSGLVKKLRRALIEHEQESQELQEFSQRKIHSDHAHPPTGSWGGRTRRDSVDTVTKSGL